MGLIVLVAGGYRSGSTLQYNLLGEYLERSGRGRRIGSILPDDAEAAAAEVANEPGIAVTKCHHLATGFREFDDEAAWGTIVRRGAAVALTTTRAQPDVERSMCRKFDLAPDGLHESLLWRENEANIAAWSELQLLNQTYAELTETPKVALTRLLDVLALPIERRALRGAARATHPRRARRQQKRVPNGQYDPVTLLHWDHIAP